jgi:hypothetical protein
MIYVQHQQHQQQHPQKNHPQPQQQQQQRPPPPQQNSTSGVDPMPMLDDTIRRGGGRVRAVQQPLQPQPPRVGHHEYTRHHEGMRRDSERERQPVESRSLGREKTDHTSELLTTDDSELLNYNDDNEEV